MVIACTSGSTSTLSTILPLTWGKRRNRLERRLRECVPLGAAIGRLSSEGDLWSGLRRCLRIGVARLFCVMDFGERCNEKERRIEETKIVKRMVKIVKRVSRCLSEKLPPRGLLGRV